MIISAGHPELGRGTGALVVRSGREIPRLRYASLRFARNDQPQNHRAEAAALIRFLHRRSEFVGAGNAVPLRF